MCNGLVDAGLPPVGFVVCLSGWVVAGADIRGARWAGEDEPAASPLLTNFDLRPPGDWYDGWRGRLLPTQVGGAALRVWPRGGRAPWDRSPRERRLG